MKDKKILIQIKHLTKIFPGVKALDDINVDIYEGEIHALLGENGAGKSTLIKILTGAYLMNEGEVIINGEKVNINAPSDALKYRIGAIYQELTLIPQLSIMENIYLGFEPLRKQNPSIIDWKRLKKQSYEILQILGLNINPSIKVSNLGMGIQQMIEIAKVLVRHPKVLIMDEPTSSLSSEEVKQLFKVIKNLKERGITIIYISHKLEEIMELADRVTILRDGKKIETVNICDTNEEELIKMMVGRKLKEKFPKCISIKTNEALRVKNLTGKNFNDVSFNVKHGEILGIYGLVGAGRTELARAIFGADPIDKGEIWVDGQLIRIKSPIEAISHKIAFLTEDRKSQGLILKNTIEFNINLPSLSIYFKNKYLKLKDLAKRANNMINQLKIQPPNKDLLCLNLSGGNQQKVVIAKWLLTNSKIFIFDEPTRGIDVGSKVEVYNIINSLLSKGAAVIMISSELEEILGMSDRIIVMHEGKITGMFTREDATQEKIVAAAIGRV
jgi:ribose transport system ATP-binding protein